MSQSLMEDQLIETVCRDLGMESNGEKLTYQELLDSVSDQVGYYLESRPETLFSLLYRLDVSEPKVEKVMLHESDSPKNVMIAELIIQRQMDRIETKRKYKQEKIEGWDEF